MVVLFIGLRPSAKMTSVYDGAGQRLQSTSGGQTRTFVYDAFGQIAAEYVSGLLDREYVYRGGEALCIIEASGALKYLFTDLVGTPRVVTDGSAAIVSRHDYAPFGEEIAAGVGSRTSGQGYNATDNVRQGYSGMEKDSATNLSHTRWRKYDRASGRWNSPDPYAGSVSLSDPQSHNRYSYVQNDPVNFVDPTGLAFIEIPIWACVDGHCVYSPDYVWVDDELFGGGGLRFPDFLTGGGGGGMPPNPTLADPRDPGKPLSDCVKRLLSSWFSELDLSKVNAHKGLPGHVRRDATAYTEYYDIYFRDGIDQNSIDGIALIGHELTHTRQFKRYDSWRHPGGFPARYLAEAGRAWWKGGDPAGRGNRFENEAYNMEASLKKQLQAQYGNKNPCP